MVDATKSVRWDIVILYTAAIAGYPLIAGIPVILGVDSRFVSVPYRAAILGISILAIGRSWVRGELYRGALWAPLGLFWLLYVGRMLSDTLIDPVPLSRPGTEYLAYGLGQTFIPMVALLTKPSDATLRAGLRGTILVGTIAAVSALAIGAVLLLNGDLEIIGSGRFRLPTLDPISVGELGASVATLAIFRLQSDVGARALPRAGLLFSVAIGLICTVLSGSKGPLIALAVLVPLLLVLDWRRGHATRSLAAGIAIPAIGIQSALLVEEKLGFAVLSRFRPVLENADVESVTQRVELLRGARDQFLANPLTGSSLEERVWLSYPHNTFIDGFMAVGLVGGLAYVIFHLAALLSAARLALSQPAAAWVTLMCVQYTVTEQFSGSLYLSSSMWAFLAAVVATQSRLRDHIASTPPIVHQSIKPTDGLEPA